MLLRKRAGNRNSEGANGVVRNEDEEEFHGGRDHWAGYVGLADTPGRDGRPYRPGG